MVQRDVEHELGIYVSWPGRQRSAHRTPTTLTVKNNEGLSLPFINRNRGWLASPQDRAIVYTQRPAQLSSDPLIGIHVAHLAGVQIKEKAPTLVVVCVPGDLLGVGRESGVLAPSQLAQHPLVPAGLEVSCQPLEVAVLGRGQPARPGPWGIVCSLCPGQPQAPGGYQSEENDQNPEASQEGPRVKVSTIA